MVKALVLLSGGLDSMLAAKVLMEQGIEVTGVSFKSYFFGTGKAKKVAKQLGIELIEADFSEEHLKMVKNPKYGYGKNMNPCIDCHALMLTKAKDIMEKGKPASAKASAGKYDFVATGEVLGERPMSQNPDALKMVEKISGLKGKLIRPLSAKLLEETDLEKTGEVNREKLLAISGRSRKPQFELVKKYGIKEYANPGGGCLLTDPVFSEKLMEMLEYWPDCQGDDIVLLKYGRIYWLEDEQEKKVLLVIGRDETENQELENKAKTGDVIFQLVDEAGPTALIRIMNHESLLRQGSGGQVRIMEEIQEIDVPSGLKMSELKMGQAKNQEEIIRIASLLTGYHAVKARGKKVKLAVRQLK
jgi:tRNA U34 2-thiouridine synthase MnmA/TrmU